MKFNKIVLFFSLFLFAAKFSLEQTDGFALSKISTYLLEKRAESIDLSPLKMKYFYLSKGGQSYVFISVDGNYILKFFRASRLNFLNLFKGLLPVRWSEKQEAILKRTFQSYLLAEEHLKEQTGLLGVHVSQTPFNCPPLKIIDKLGIEHIMDLSSISFVLQKRAKPVKTHINDLIAKGDVIRARKALTTLFDFLKERIRAGIQDEDPNISKNFGFIKDQVIQFDAGNFKIDKPITIDRILSSAQDLQHWINKNHPQLSKCLQEEVQKFIIQYEAF